MAVYTRKDSPFYWMHLEGFTDDQGRPLRESTRIRRDARTPKMRAEAKNQALDRYHRRMLALADEGKEPGKKPPISFNAFVDWWEKHKLPARRGREREASTLPRLRAFFRDTLLQKIDRSLAAEYATWRQSVPTEIAAKKRTKARQAKAGPSTVNREIDTLKAILQAAVPKYLPLSPLYGMKRLPTLTPKRRNLTEDEEHRLLEALKPEDRALFLFGLDTLTRMSDILDVRRKDDHGDRVWIADSKTAGGYYVAISTRLRAALDALPAGKPNDYLFANRRKGKTEHARRNAVKRMLERACQAADPPVPYGRLRDGITFHWATRRTGATRMLARGVPLATVQKVGRWKDAHTVTGIYYELIGDAERLAVEAVAPLPQNTPPLRQPETTQE